MTRGMRKILYRAERHPRADERFYISSARKGVSREIAQQVVEECFDGQDETEAILKIIEKKRVDLRTATPEQMQKLYGHLARKGFRYEDIRQVIQNYDENA